MSCPRVPADEGMTMPNDDDTTYSCLKDEGHPGDHVWHATDPPGWVGPETETPEPHQDG